MSLAAPETFAPEAAHEAERWSRPRAARPDPRAMRSAMVRPKRTGPIVVAVDGTDPSASAMAWACAHADVVGAELRVITAYSAPSVGNDSASAYLRNYDAAEAAATARVSALVAAVCGDRKVETILTPGSIERALDDHAGDARMIVLGTRRTGGWFARLRGSFTNRLTGKSSVPVVSVPHEPIDPDG